MAEIAPGSAMAVGQAMALVPLINTLLEEGHLLIEEGRIVISEELCGDPRFAWSVWQCRSAL
jgi:hypothetical protein